MTDVKALAERLRDALRDFAIGHEAADLIEQPAHPAPVERVQLSDEQIAALAAFAGQHGRQWIGGKGQPIDTTLQWRIVTMAAEFAALVGSRQMEFLRLHWPQWDADEVRLQRGKQRKGVELVERVASSPALAELRTRLQAVARDGRLGAVFPNRQGNPYTSSGFAAMWGKLMREAVAKGVIEQRFAFHDLRSHYVTRHQAERAALPQIHRSPTTTAKVYERSKVARRGAL